jgi:hypothetical protein
MTRTAIICAYNPRNCGMYSVDLSAKRFFEELGVAHDLCVTQGPTEFGKLRYRLVRSVAELRDYSAVVYWGDFLNNPMWGHADYAQREMTLYSAPSLAQGFRNWQQLYLEAGPHLTASTRILAFGGAFIGMEPFMEDRSIAETFGRFMRRTTAVIPRDPASFAHVAGWSAPSSTVSLGFDCASLMTRRSPARWRLPYFAYSFRRSMSKGDARSLVLHMERETGLRGVRVKWLTPRRSGPALHAEFLVDLALMRHARFCLTDTYHFAVNSMAQGSLPLCVVRDEAAVGSTLNEEKKRLLFRMNQLDAALLHLPGECHHPAQPDHLRNLARAAAATVRSLTQSDEWRDGYLGHQARLRNQVSRQFA